jgi:cyanate permease
MERSLFVALLLICAGIGIRSLPSAALLFTAPRLSAAVLRLETCCCRAYQT